MPLGDRIKRARLARRFSLDRLGDAIGVSRQLVWQWERGKSDPRKHIGALSRVLNYPPDYFHEDAEDRSDTLETKIQQLSEGNREVIESTVDAMLVSQARGRSRSVK